MYDNLVRQHTCVFQSACAHACTPKTRGLHKRRLAVHANDRHTKFKEVTYQILHETSLAGQSSSRVQQRWLAAFNTYRNSSSTTVLAHSTRGPSNRPRLSQLSGKQHDMDEQGSVDIWRSVVCGLVVTGGRAPRLVQAVGSQAMTRRVKGNSLGGGWRSPPPSWR